MSETEDKLRDIQKRISVATAQRARHEVEAENAQKSLDSAKATLKDEFGVTTSAELAQLQENLETQLQENLETAERLLAEAEATSSA